MLREQLSTHLRAVYTNPAKRSLTYNSDHPIDFTSFPPHELSTTYIDKSESFGQTTRFEIKGPVLLKGNSIDIEWVLPAFNTSDPSTDSVKNLGSFAFFNNLVVDLSSEEIYQVLNDELFWESYVFTSEEERVHLRETYHCDKPLTERRKMSKSDMDYRIHVPLKRNSNNQTMEYPIFYIPKGKVLGITMRFRPIDQIFEGDTTDVKDITNLRLHYVALETTATMRQGIAKKMMLPSHNKHLDRTMNPLHLQPFFGRILYQYIANGTSNQITIDLSERASAPVAGFLFWMIPEADYNDQDFFTRSKEIEKIKEYEFRKQNYTIGRFTRGYKMSKINQMNENLKLPDHILYHPLGPGTFFTHKNDHLAPTVHIGLMNNDYTMIVNFSAAISGNHYFCVFQITHAVMEVLAKDSHISVLVHKD